MLAHTYTDMNTHTPAQTPCYLGEGTTCGTDLSSKATDSEASLALKGKSIDL